MSKCSDNPNIQSLGGDCFAVISEQHRFGTDAFLLADFARPGKDDKAADLGTGCGIIPLLWHRRRLCRSITGLELRLEGAELAKQGVILSGAEEKISILCGDLREAKSLFPAASFDVVSCNPPYKAIGTGLLSAGEAALSARHEHTCTLEDVCRAAAILLRYGGRFALCQRPERLTDLLCTLRENGLEPKRLRFVHQCPGKPPWLVLIEGRRFGKKGLTVLPPLFMETQSGEKTKELQNIYKGWDEA